MSTALSTPLMLTNPASREIGEEIRAAHNKANGTARKALEYAAECGRLLANAKSRVSHGEWGRWVRLHAGMSHRQATNYMRIASNWQRVADFKGSIRDTIKLLTVMDSPPQDEPPPPTPDPAPAFKSKPSPPTVLDAEIVEPSGDPEPAPLVIDGTKKAHKPDGLKELEAEVDEGIADLRKSNMILPTIVAMLPSLTRDELCALKRAIAQQWDTLTGRPKQ